MSKEIIKRPEYTAAELNSNIAYGMISENNITKEELDSIQWLCEKSMNDDIKINNLQSQLAKKEKERHEEWKIGKEWKWECDRLKMQLAEKDKQLENAQNLKSIEVADELSLKLSKIHNQDKISFCIEQLEKVKEFFLEEHRDEEMDTDYLITKDAGEIADFLLNQIRQLKDKQINELKGDVG